jgi:hypothetical protein
MDAVITEVPIKKIKIDGNDIYLENFETGKGKITITTPNGLSYSYFWGAMGSDLETFIQDIDSDYFAKNLIPHNQKLEMDVKGTFKNLRKYIREEIGLKWYQEMEFQKDLREVLNDFQQECEENPNANYFVLFFDSSITQRLDKSLIDDRWIKKDFESFDEVWYFIIEKPTMEYMRLKMLHTKLVKHLKKQK